MIRLDTDEALRQAAHAEIKDALILMGWAVFAACAVVGAYCWWSL